MLFRSDVSRSLQPTQVIVTPKAASSSCRIRSARRKECASWVQGASRRRSNDVPKTRWGIGWAGKTWDPVRGPEWMMVREYSGGMFGNATRERRSGQGLVAALPMG